MFAEAERARRHGRVAPSWNCSTCRPFRRAMATVVLPALAELTRLGTPFSGLLYTGLC